MLHSFRHTLLVLLMLFFPLAQALGEEQKLDQTRQNLKQIEERIAKAAQSLSAKQGQEKALHNDLKTVERELEQLGARVSTQQKRLDALAQDIAGAERDIAQQQQASKGLQEQVQRRLVAIYKGGDVGLLMAFSGATSPARMLEDYEYFSRIVRKDRELLAVYRQRLAELEVSRNKLSTLRQEQEVLVAQDLQARDAQKKAAQLKKRLLSKVQKDKTAIAAELAELKARAARLSDLVKKLESTKAPEYTQKSSFFQAQKGKLPWPVNGKIKVGFGPGRHAELGTLYESHGIEISAAPNQKVAAVWAGRVAFASWFNGYGNLLIVDHGDGYFTLYAQAARLEKKVGEQVKQGEVVALAGYEGKEVAYFEIRHRGTPLDPVAWLKSR